MRVVPLLGALLGVALATGCSRPVEHLAGDATPAGAASPGSTAPSSAPTANPPASSPAASTAPTAPTASRPASPTPGPRTTVTGQSRVLGPNGLGALRLGMTKAQAEATGLIAPLAPYEGNYPKCSLRTSLRGAPPYSDPLKAGVVYYDDAQGVQIIDAYGSLHTPEGVRIGSSMAAVRKAYPQVTVLDDPTAKNPEGRALVPVPGNSRAHYAMELHGGRVIELTLQLKTQTCYAFE